MKILLDGYLDMNFGDDIMIRMFAEEFKDYQIDLICEDKVLFKAFESVKNIRPVSRKRGFINQIRQIKRYDAYIKIGGSLYNVTSFRMALRWLIKTPKYMYLKIIKQKMAVIGCNLGPFNGKLGEWVTRIELKCMGLVTVRDKNSYRLLKRFGVKNKMIFPDIVLSLDINNNKFSSNRNGSLGISAYRSINSRELNYDNYLYLAKIADTYIERTKKRVILYAFDSENENDIAAAYNIYEHIKNKDLVDIYIYNGNIDSFLEHLNKADVFISVRFHAVIMAMKFKKMFIPIVYSNKTENLLDDFNYNGLRLYTNNITELPISNIINIILSTKNKYQINRSDDFKLGRKHFHSVRAYLESDTAQLKELKHLSDRFYNREVDTL